MFYTFFPVQKPPPLNREQMDTVPRKVRWVTRGKTQISVCWGPEMEKRRGPRMSLGFPLGSLGVG